MGNMAMPNKGNVSTEWWISHLRWALLVALLLISTQLLSQTARFLPALVVLLAAGLYNLSVTLLLYFNRSFRFLDELTLALDTALPVLLAYLSVQPSYFLMALFPIIVAGLKFGTEISLLVASLVSAAYGGFVFFLQPWLVAGEAMLSTLVTILILFVTAAATGLLGPKTQGASRCRARGSAQRCLSRALQSHL
jgi:hypothetical protein